MFCVIIFQIGSKTTISSFNKISLIFKLTPFLGDSNSSITLFQSHSLKTFLISIPSMSMNFPNSFFKNSSPITIVVVSPAFSIISFK